MTVDTEHDVVDSLVGMVLWFFVVLGVVSFLTFVMLWGVTL